MPLSLHESVARAKPRTSEPAVLAERARHLADGDRHLLQAVLVRRQSARCIAQLTGQDTHTVHRHVRRLLRRLHSRRFLAVLRALPVLEGPHQAVAAEHLLAGRSLRATARRTGLKYHRVRRLAGEIRALADGLQALQRRYPALLRTAAPEAAGARSEK